MPIEVLTGFAAYCVAAASAFYDVASRYALGSDTNHEGLKEGGRTELSKAGCRERMTPEICFGAELFGYDRFLADASTRLRTWRLRGNWRGVSNRFTIFQDLWLNQETLDEIHSARKGIREIDFQIKAIVDAEKWLVRQEQQLDATINHRYTDGMGYKPAVLVLAEKTAEEYNRLQNELSLHTDYSFELAYILNAMCEWMEEQGAIFVHALSNQSDQSELVTAVELFDSGSIKYLGVLKEFKKELVKKKKALYDQLSDSEKRAKWQEESVTNCVNDIMDDNASILWGALQEMGAKEFGLTFSSKVTPAIEEGFKVEGYLPARINAFRAKLDNAVNALPGGESRSSVDRYREFMTLLVDSVIYGPEGGRQKKGTNWEEDFEPVADNELGEFIVKQIVVSQQLSDDGSLVGRSSIFGPNDVIFLGRYDEVGAYVEKCKEIMSPEAFEALNKKRLTVFPIAEAHGQVSNLHGMIWCEEDGWLYRDFSRFGTRLVGKGKDDDKLDVLFVGKPHELKAGNVLYLGATPKDKGQRLFFKAAAIKMSVFLDVDGIDFL